LKSACSDYSQTLPVRTGLAPQLMLYSGNTILLVLALAWPLDDRAHLGRLTTLQIVYSTELCVCLPCLVLYLGALHTRDIGNKERPIPARCFICIEGLLCAAGLNSLSAEVLSGTIVV
jgi:hypothetical protein